MIHVKTFVFNPFGVNCYVLFDQTNQCVIVDAACYEQHEKTKLLEYITTNNLKPVKIINTHGHVDHVLGWKFASETWQLTPQIHELELPLLKQALEHGIMFGFNVEPLPNVTNYLAEGVNVTFGNSELQVFHVPGHSMGSVAFYSEPDAFVIAGDVLFKNSIGRTDLPGGNFDTLINSINTKLLTLPNSTLVLCGHGPTTTIGDEKNNNPFLN